MIRNPNKRSMILCQIIVKIIIRIQIFRINKLNLKLQIFKNINRIKIFKNINRILIVKILKFQKQIIRMYNRVKLSKLNKYMWYQ